MNESQETQPKPEAGQTVNMQTNSTAERTAGSLHRDGSATCCECNWTNVSLLNLGEPGRNRWVCHGCCKRALEMLDKVKAALSPNDTLCEVADKARPN